MLPSTFVQQVKATCPDVMELDLRSNTLKELPKDLVDLKFGGYDLDFLYLLSAKHLYKVEGEGSPGDN